MQDYFVHGEDVVVVMGFGRGRGGVCVGRDASAVWGVDAHFKTGADEDAGGAGGAEEFAADGGPA